MNMQNSKKQHELKLSSTGKLLVSLSLAYLGASSAFAQNIQAIGDTTVSKKGKVDIVNIAAPTEQGLSHNKYNKYNVAKEGAVLNNALKAGKSQLAGNLEANKNLRDKAASVILNEVVSKNPSLILGKQEVFGMAADYVLANPNGITYNGGSIINAPRASLVVGTPEVAGGKLNAVRTGEKNSQAALTVNGNVDGVSVLDLVAPKVIVNAKANVQAEEAINVVSGSNKVGYTDGTVEKLTQNAKAPVLDGQIFGGMRAGSIRIHASDERGQQQIQGANIAASKDLVTNVAGNLNIKAAKLSGEDVALVAKNTNIDGVVSKKRDKAYSNSGKRSMVAAYRHVENNVDVFENRMGTSQDFKGSSIQAKNLALRNTGNVNLKGATLNADAFELTANNVVTDGVRTSNDKTAIFNKRKALWHNNSNSSEHKETLHASVINVKDNAVFDISNKATLKGTQVTVGKDLSLSAQNGVVLEGLVTRDTSSEAVDYRNETKVEKVNNQLLKTGHAKKSFDLETFHATQINAGGNVVIGSSNANLDATGAKVHAGGNLLTEVQRVHLKTASTKDKSIVDDKARFFGGAKEGFNNLTDETLHGAALVAGGEVLLNTKKGVDIRGSAVKGTTGAFVNAGSGKSTITHVNATDHLVNRERIGTIFNITKKSSSTESSEQTAVGSTLHSDADLLVRSEKDMDVIGSQLKAKNNVRLNVEGTLNVGAAKTQSHYNNASFAIEGYKKGNADAENLKASGGIGLSFTKKTEVSDVTRHQGSSIEAGEDITLNVQGKPGDLNVQASTLAAKNDIQVNANNITFSAAYDQNNTNASQRVTNVGIGAGVDVNGGTPKVTVSIGVDSAYSQTDSASKTAQVSTIKGNNVNLATSGNESAIHHEATKIQATGSVSQRAGKGITHTAAQNSVDATTVEHKGGIGVEFSASADQVLGVKGTIHGSGGKTVANSTTAVVGSIEAGNKITQHARGTVTDVGTQYNAKGDVNITAVQYVNEAAQNTSKQVSNKGGAELSVGASTSDFNTIDVKVGGKVFYQHEKGNKTEAVKGTLNGDSVTVNVLNNATIAADITANQDVLLVAGEGVTLTESKNTANSVSGGFELGGSVGVKVIPAAGVVVPSSYGVNAKVNYGKRDESKGTGANVQAGRDIVVDGGSSVDLQGTNLVGLDDVTVKGDKVTSNVATSTVDETGVKVGVGVNVAADGKSFGFDGDLDVKREKGLLYTANKIQGGEDVTITGNSKGQGVSLTGTQIEGNKVSVTNPIGVVHLGSAQGHYNRTEVGLGLNFTVDTDTITHTETKTWTEKDMCGNEHTFSKDYTYSEDVTKLTSLGGRIGVDVERDNPVVSTKIKENNKPQSTKPQPPKPQTPQPQPQTPTPQPPETKPTEQPSQPPTDTNMDL